MCAVIIIDVFHSFVYFIQFTSDNGRKQLYGLSKIFDKGSLICKFLKY